MERTQWLEQEIRRSNTANSERFDRFLFIKRHFSRSPSPNALNTMESAGHALSIATMKMFLGFEQTVATARALAVEQTSSIDSLDRRVSDLEQLRSSMMESVRTMQALSRTMADRTFTAIEDFEGRLTRFNNRLNIVERVSFDEPPATRGRIGAAPGEGEGAAW